MRKVFLALLALCMFSAAAQAYSNEPERIDGWSWGAPLKLSSKSLEYHSAVKGVPEASMYIRKGLRCSYLYSIWPEEVHVFVDGKYSGIILGAGSYLYVASAHAKMVLLHGNPDRSWSSDGEQASLWNGQVTSILFMRMVVNKAPSILVILGTPAFLGRFISANSVNLGP